LRDLAPVAHIGTIEFAFSTGPMSRARSLEEMIAWLRQNPDKAAFASPGVGTIPHLIGVLFAQAAKIDLRHVPYRGTAPALQDVLAGQIALSSTTAAEFGEHHRAGSIRMLALSGAGRSPFWPEVPTWRDQGFDFDAEGWFGTWVPAGTPRAIIDRYSEIFTSAVRSEAGRALLSSFKVPPTGGPPEELDRVQRADAAKWSAIIKAAGIRAEE
jgi:tripartite-type tricarboxylate transporter receptor subunit TctC